AAAPRGGPVGRGEEDRAVDTPAHAAVLVDEAAPAQRPEEGVVEMPASFEIGHVDPRVVDHVATLGVQRNVRSAIRKPPTPQAATTARLPQSKEPAAGTQAASRHWKNGRIGKTDATDRTPLGISFCGMNTPEMKYRGKA